MHAAGAVLLLVVRTYNAFGVPPGELDVAKRVSGDILRRAGIEMIWIDCTGSSALAPANPTCGDGPQADEVMVRIVGAPGGQRKDVATDTLGYAYVDTAAGIGSLATLCADRIAAMARASGLDAGTLLGRVMAHEIGHLLLGTTAHQSQGLMRAQWSSALLQRYIGADWQFSRGEVERLDRNLAARKQALSLEP
jgi:hypothetical protein